MTSRNSKKDTPGTVVIQVKREKGPLSKEQLAFNKLTARIDFLRNSINAETEKLDALNKIYQKDVFTEARALGHLKIKLSHQLHNKRSQVKLSKVQSNKLDQLIFELLDDAFSVVEPDEDTRRLYDSYRGPTVKERIAQLLNDYADQFEFVSEEEYREKYFNSGKKGGDQSQRLGKKTKKQLEKEALAEKKEALKKKSLRSIYISLVKILHPDTEPDAALKTEKEETIKKVTSAYENGDMAQLLQIEMQWVKTHEELLAKVDNDTMGIYVQLLKDQVAELETARATLHLQERYTHVAMYKSENIQSAKADLRMVVRRYKETCLHVQKSLRSLESANPAAAIKKWIAFQEDDAQLFENELDF